MGRVLKDKGMEERLTYITESTDKWLSGILCSNFANFYLLSGDNNLPDDGIFEIKENKISDIGVPLFLKTRNLLVFKDEVANEKFMTELRFIFERQIQVKEYTLPGVLNFVILINSIGDLDNVQIYDLSVLICKAVPLKKKAILLDIVIDLFNGIYEINKLAPSLVLVSTPDEWIRLFNAIKYSERINNSVNLLIICFQELSNKANSINMMCKLHPFPRAAVLEYDVNIIKSSGVNVCNFLAKHPAEAGFVCALLIDSKQVPNFFNRKLCELLVRNSWGSSGRYLFKVIYSSPRPINKQVEGIACQEITKLLEPVVYSNRSNPEILGKMVWPGDYVALGGWLKIQEENSNKTINIRSNENLMDHFATIIAEQLEYLKVNIPRVLCDNMLSEIWLGDPFNLNVQYIQIYLNLSLMNVGKLRFDLIKSNFKKLCLEIKVLLYASATGRRIGMKLANVLLIMLLNFPDDTNRYLGIERLKELFSIFSSILALQWIFYAEQNRFIWSDSEYSASFGDTDLMFIVRKLSYCPANYFCAIRPLTLMIEEHKTTEWSRLGSLFAEISRQS